MRLFKKKETTPHDHMKRNINEQSANTEHRTHPHRRPRHYCQIRMNDKQKKEKRFATH